MWLLPRIDGKAGRAQEFGRVQLARAAGTARLFRLGGTDSVGRPATATAAMLAQALDLVSRFVARRALPVQRHTRGAVDQPVEHNFRARA